MLVPGTERVKADPSSSERESSEHRQRSRMVMALAVLLLALGVVLLKDRELMPSAASAPEANFVEEQPALKPVVPTAEASTESLPHNQPTQPSATERKRKTPPPATPEPSQEQPVVATERAVLPPLDVQVIAGNQQHALVPASNAVKVDMGTPATRETGVATEPAPPVARVQVSRDVTTRVSRSVQPEYPVLAKQMKVQGAVVLQALIGKEGSIQDLHVVTGPAILAAAAQEAVRQWHFKPYFEGGQAVETEARITVNFTISTY